MNIKYVDNKVKEDPFQKPVQTQEVAEETELPVFFNYLFDSKWFLFILAIPLVTLIFIPILTSIMREMR